MEKSEQITVTIGDGVVVIRRSGVSRASVANILGMEHDSQCEIKTLWLDRLIHGPNESGFIGWRVSGAVSSVLERCAV